MIAVTTQAPRSRAGPGLRRQGASRGRHRVAALRLLAADCPTRSSPIFEQTSHRLGQPPQQGRFNWLLDIGASRSSTAHTGSHTSQRVAGQAVLDLRSEPAIPQLLRQRHYHTRVGVGGAHPQCLGQCTGEPVPRLQGGWGRLRLTGLRAANVGRARVSLHSAIRRSPSRSATTSVPRYCDSVSATWSTSHPFADQRCDDPGLHRRLVRPVPQPGEQPPPRRVRRMSGDLIHHPVLRLQRVRQSTSPELSVFQGFDIQGVPEQLVGHSVQCHGRSTASREVDDVPNEVLASEDLVEQRPHQVDVFVADLDEDRPRLGQQVTSDDETVAQVGQI